jgi:DNA polymerase-1
MLVGEAPGRNEDETGVPFTRQAGEYLNSLLETAGLSRDEVIISNTVKCRPKNNRTPTVDEARYCANRWLDLEMAAFKPEIVVPMGRVAIEYLTGETNVEHVHGIPFVKDGAMVLPVYHPAAGFHDTRLMRHIQGDFEILGKLVRGEPIERVEDEWAGEEMYIDMGEPFGEPQGEDDGRIVALDTETVDGELWSVQLSDVPGGGLFFSGVPEYLPILKHIVVHNYSYDSRFVQLPENTDDTMLMAYLLGLPQGLKGLAWRLCGMEMDSYQETIGGHRKDKAMAYLEEAVSLEVPDPPLLEDTSWSKKENRLVTSSKQPQHITKKIKRIIADVVGGKRLKDGPVDPYARWHNIDKRERAEVERELGVMRDASLEDVPMDEVVHYACRDSDATLRVFQILSERIDRLGLRYVYELDKRTLPIALEMMRNGIKLDSTYLNNLSRHYLELLEMKAEAIFSTEGVGRRFNPNSDNEVRKLLFEELGFTPSKFTETGLPSVSKDELPKIDHPVVPLLMEYKHLAHLKDSFCDTLPGKVDEFGRIHPTINVTRTETGRWSMKEPNLQQIPSRSELGKAIRKAFVSEEGNFLVAIDYSQIEMRVAAHLTGCRSMIDLFLEGRDIHTETASQIFGVPVDQVTSWQRYPTKTMGFGVIYGLTPHGLFNQMSQEGLEDWDERACEKFIKEYYQLRPELGAWQDQTRAFAEKHGYVTDMFGRLRYIPEMLCPVKRYRGAGERQAINMPIQSTAQGILKAAMIRMGQEETSFPWFWLLQIHDELMFEVEAPHAPQFIWWATKIMESAVKLSVPIKVEAKMGTNWGEMA